MKHDEERLAYLDAAAAEVYRQAAENPGLGIPVDPDVAEYMGAGCGTMPEGDADAAHMTMAEEQRRHEPLDRPSKKHLITPQMSEAADRLATTFFQNAIAINKRMQEDREFRKQAQAEIF